MSCQKTDVIDFIELTFSFVCFCEGVRNCWSFEKPTMEEYLKLVEKGNMGVETALADLGLEGIYRITKIFIYRAYEDFSYSPCYLKTWYL